MIRAAVLCALVAAVVVAEPPARFRPRTVFGVQQRPNSRAARLEEAPPAQQEPAGYNYPKPMSSGYHYPKPDQAFPLPGEEMAPAFTTTEAAPAAETTAVPQEATTESSDSLTTTAAYEDYEDATAPLEPAPADADTSAKLRRRQQLAARRPAPLTLFGRQSQRLEDLPAVLVDEQPAQPLTRPLYLINLPESTLQQLVLLNNAQLAGLPLAAPQPTAVYLSELDYIYKKK